MEEHGRDTKSDEESEFETEEVATASGPPDVRVSWIYNLKKEELQCQLSKFCLDISGTVDELRRRLVRYMREGLATPSPHLQQFAFPGVPITHFPNLTPTPPTVSVPASTPTSIITTVTATTVITPPHTVCAGKPNVTFALPPTVFTTALPQNPPVDYASYNPTRPFYNFPQNHTTTAGSCSPLQPAVPTIQVHTWRLHFDGRGDPVAFIERVQEICGAQNIPLDALLPHMPDLLQGGAALWFRNNRRDWQTWAQFIADFRSFYFPINYAEDLELEINHRQQRSNEPVGNYFTDLQTLIRRHGGMGPDEELKWLYRHTSPTRRLSRPRHPLESGPGGRASVSGITTPRQADAPTILRPK